MPRIEGDRVSPASEYSLAVDQIVSEREEPYVFGSWPVSTVRGRASDGAKKSGGLVDRDPVDRADQVCPLKNVAPLEQLVAAHCHIRFGRTADQCVLVIQVDESVDVTALICLGYPVEQDTSARHWNHAFESVEGAQPAAWAGTVLHQRGRDS